MKKKNRNKKLQLSNNPNVGFLHYKQVTEEDERFLPKNNGYVGYINHAKKQKNMSLLTMILTDNVIDNGLIRSYVHNMNTKKLASMNEKESEYEILEKPKEKTQQIFDWDIFPNK